MKIIARIHTGFEEKFGIPRQSGLAQTQAEIIFEPPYNIREAVRGLEEFSHLWILWDFSECHKEQQEREWYPTVRPPRLGGNRRIGVFATRSPYRPNHIGLSCVRLKEVVFDHRGPVLRVLGADLLNGTPIYDIKPYLPYADSFPDAKSGFASSAPKRTEVEFSCPVPGGISDEMLADIRELLKQDPRPAYQRDPGRIYGMKYAGVEIKFKGSEEKITVCDISFYPSI